MKRLISVIITLAMLLTFVTACGSENNSPGVTSKQSQAAAASSSGDKTVPSYDGVTITVLMEGHPSSNSFEKIKGEFEKETGIKVNTEIIPYEELPQKVLLGFSQKSKTYDMIMNDRIYMEGYITNKYITPLDEFISNNSLNKYYDESDFVPAYINAVKYQDKTYGFPVYGESTFLMYRKDLFEQYGVKVPGTMTELKEAAKTIYEKSNKQIAGITLRGQQGVHVVYTWGAFLWGFGGRYFDESGKLVIDSPGGIAGTKAYCDLLNNYGPKGYSNFGWQENRLLFQQGKAAMTIDATVNGAYCEDPKESTIVGKVGYAPVPSEVKDGYGGAASLAVHGFFINNAIDQKQKEAAFLFGSWATSAAVQEKTIALEPHSGLTSIKAMNSEAFKSKYGAFSSDMIKALEVANPNYMPTIAQANEVINKVGAALSQSLAKSKTPEEALKEVCQDINTNILKK